MKFQITREQSESLRQMQQYFNQFAENTDLGDVFKNIKIKDHFKRLSFKIILHITRRSNLLQLSFHPILLYKTIYFISACMKTTLSSNFLNPESH